MRRRLAAWKMSWAQRSDEPGQGLAEYGLILALVALGCLAALTLFGQNLANSVGFRLLPQFLN